MRELWLPRLAKRNVKKSFNLQRAFIFCFRIFVQPCSYKKETGVCVVFVYEVYWYLSRGGSKTTPIPTGRQDLQPKQRVVPSTSTGDSFDKKKGNLEGVWVMNQHNR